MDDSLALGHRVSSWNGDVVALRDLAVDMRTLFNTHAPLVSGAARALLRRAEDCLTKYQSLRFHIYAAYDDNMIEDDKAIQHLDEASTLLEHMGKASKSFVTFGVEEEHPLMAELAIEIETMRQFWQDRKPVKPDYHGQYRSPSLGVAQWLINRMRRTGTENSQRNAEMWACIGYLGSCAAYSGMQLWTSAEGPSAHGLLRDPTYKLLNLLNRSRLAGGELLDLRGIQQEVVKCRKREGKRNQDPERSDFSDPPRTPAGQTQPRDRYARPPINFKADIETAQLVEVTDDMMSRVRTDGVAGLNHSETYSAFFDPPKPFDPNAGSLPRSPMPAAIDIEEDSEIDVSVQTVVQNPPDDDDDAHAELQKLWRARDISSPMMKPLTQSQRRPSVLFGAMPSRRREARMVNDLPQPYSQGLRRAGGTVE
ncbi:unnamed protein product [Zymoseptoria tritici ST99CH_3D1]|nr:unnamed protein product [Zymoseptoria tritici ST99CH_3D1]